MTRPYREIMRDFHAILAELSYALEMQENPSAGVNTDDISPKLAQALDQQAAEARAAGRAMARDFEPSHEGIRDKARAYKDPGIASDQDRAEPGLPRDSYKPATDPNWDESVFMGTGDRREP